MRVVHINTYPVGGAASAAICLHHALLNKGIESSFLLRDSDSDVIRNSNAVLKRYPSMRQRLLMKFGFMDRGNNPYQSILSNARGDYDIFTTIRTPYRVEKHALVRDADIIHLHWIADFVNFPTFFSNVSKPIVWTCHDRNPVLGGFHLELDRGRNAVITEIDHRIAAIKEEFLNLLRKKPLWLGYCRNPRALSEPHNVLVLVQPFCS